MPRQFKKLTKSAMNRLRPGQTITENGITFRRKMNGDGAFSINVMVDRRRVHRAIGNTSDGVTRTQVEDVIAQIRTDARHARLSLPEKRKVHPGFSDISERYLEYLKSFDGKNIPTKERQLSRHLVPYFRNMELASINKKEIEGYKVHRSYGGAAHGTINRELATFSHLRNTAIANGWVKLSALRIPKYKEASGRIIALSAAQCDALLVAAKQDVNPNLFIFVTIALHTAMRHQEILAIKVEDINFGKENIWIPEAKAGSRVQPITSTLSRLLQTHIRLNALDSGFLFPAPKNKSGHTALMRKAFRRAVTVAGMDPDKITPHVMRHTTLTMLIENGVDLPTISRIAGHRSIATTLRYLHQSNQHISASMDKLDKGLTAQSNHGR